MEKSRLGHIKFINCLPLSYSLLYGGYDEGLDIYADVPAKLNRLIVQGQLDVSPVSSIVYAQHSEKFLIMPDVSISAEGALRSILLVSKKPIAELNQASVALTAKSETSHCLLKIVLHDAYQAVPGCYITEASTAGEALADADAVLFIGDDALFNYHNRQQGLFYYDIGAEWKQLTGLPMVYAVWVVRRRFARTQPELLQTVYERVTGGFRHGLANIDQAVAAFADKLPFSCDQISTYLKLLNWSLTPAHQQALLSFYQRAYHIGLLEQAPKIAFAEVLR